MSESMTIRINDRLNDEGRNWWYNNRAGEMFRVKRDPDFPKKFFFLVKNGRRHQIRCCDCKIVNREDERRRNSTINALLRAKEALETERLYLSVQEPVPMDELYKVFDGLDHVVDALDRLTAAEEVTNLGKTICTNT